MHHSPVKHDKKLPPVETLKNHPCSDHREKHLYQQIAGQVGLGIKTALLVGGVR